MKLFLRRSYHLSIHELFSPSFSHQHINSYVYFCIFFSETKLFYTELHGKLYNEKLTNPKEVEILFDNLKC